MGFKELVQKLLGKICSPSDSDIEKINNTNINDNNLKLSFFKNSKLFEIKNETINNNLTVNIDLSKVSEEQIKSLLLIYNELRDQGAIFLQNKNHKDVLEYKNESKDMPLLKFFKGKLKEEDHKILRDSIFIKKKSDNGEDISEYLDQLYRKFGVRGRNMCNLYCEGYFDTFIRPYYVSLAGEGKIDDFYKGFDDFVIELPLTYFINQHKTQEQINKELNDKIEKNKKYGIKRLNIHGINKNNVIKAVEFLKNVSQNTDIKIVSRNETEDHISIIVEIL